MSVTYSLWETSPTGNPDFRRLDMLMVLDREQTLMSTHYGMVYISREDAARILREARRRQHKPPTIDGVPAYIVTIEKEKNALRVHRTHSKGVGACSDHMP